MRKVFSANWLFFRNKFIYEHSILSLTHCRESLIWLHRTKGGIWRQGKTKTRFAVTQIRSGQMEKILFVSVSVSVSISGFNFFCIRIPSHQVLIIFSSNECCCSFAVGVDNKEYSKSLFLAKRLIKCTDRINISAKEHLKLIGFGSRQFLLC